jgi:hypothetical protein
LQRCCVAASSILNLPPDAACCGPSVPLCPPRHRRRRLRSPTLRGTTSASAGASSLPPPHTPHPPPPSPLPPAQTALPHLYLPYSNSSLLLFPIKLPGFVNSNPVQRGANTKCATGLKGRSSLQRTPSCATRPTTTSCTTPRPHIKHAAALFLKRFFLSYTDMRMAGDKQTLVLARCVNPALADLSHGSPCRR